MTRSKVLVVDDEVDFCMIMKEYFLSRNYDISLSYNLNDGLKTLEGFQPDILLLDNNLPDGKGWEHIETITKKFPSMKVFLISAYSHRSDISTTLSNVIVWEKPVSLSQLDAIFKV